MLKNLKAVLPSKRARWILGSIGVLILALLIFHAGVAVGFHQKEFSQNDAMQDSFRDPFLPGGFATFALPHGFIPNTHGAVGTITTTALPILSIQTREGTTQKILISSSTIIRDMDTVRATELSVGDQIIVLGEQDSEGRIDAKIIRVHSATQSSLRPATTATPQ